MITELWRDIPGLIHYQASSLGRIRSKDRIIPHRTKGGVMAHQKWPQKILKLKQMKSGYLFFIPGYKQKNISVHRAVALAFIPNPDSKREVNHINGNKKDNAVENLEWVTPKENMRHAISIGHIRKSKVSLAALACLFLFSCRESSPPQLSIICLGDGFGGADCVDSSGNKVYKSPSQLLNYWMTTEADEQNFSSWCYGGDAPAAAAVKIGMSDIKDQVK